jgi:hypothetical protein
MARRSSKLSYHIAALSRNMCGRMDAHAKYVLSGAGFDITRRPDQVFYVYWCIFICDNITLAKKTAMTK